MAFGSHIFLISFTQKNWLRLQCMTLFIWRELFLRSRSQFSAGDFRVFYKTLDHLYNKQSSLSDWNTIFSSPHKQLSGHNPRNNHYCYTRPREVNDHHWHFQKSTLSQKGNLLTAETEASTFRTFWGMFKVFWLRPQDLCILIEVTKKRRGKCWKLGGWTSIIPFSFPSHWQMVVGHKLLLS